MLIVSTQSDEQLCRLDKLAANGTCEWELCSVCIIQDNVLAGVAVLAAKGPYCIQKTVDEAWNSLRWIHVASTKEDCCLKDPVDHVISANQERKETREEKAQFWQPSARKKQLIAPQYLQKRFMNLVMIHHVLNTRFFLLDIQYNALNVI